MNYLLFVYYDNTVKNSEKTTNEIAKQIADQMSSNEAKFMFGEKHAIFHFASEFSIDDMGGWIDIINDELQCFEYFLVPKPRNSVSNMTKENLEHLLTLRKTKPKKKTRQADDNLHRLPIQPAQFPWQYPVLRWSGTNTNPRCG